MPFTYGSIEKSVDLADRFDGNPGKVKRTECDGSFVDDGVQNIDIEEALENAGFTKKHVISLLVISVVVTATYTQLEANNILGPELLCEWDLSGAQEALVTGSLFWGSAVGSLVWGKIVDKKGRRSTLMACSCLTFIFLLLSVFSTGYLFFSICGLLTGVAFGGLHNAYTYATEIVSSAHRTTASSILFASQAAGTFLGSMLGLLLIPNENLGWKYYQGTISLLFFLGFIFLFLVPETPRFLHTCGNSKEALDVIRKFNPECNQFVDLQPVITQDRGSFKALIKDSFCLKTLLVLIIVTSMIRMDKHAVGLLFLESLQNPESKNCLLVSGYDHEKRGCDRLTTKDYSLDIMLSTSHAIGAIISKPMADFFGRRRSLLIFGFITVLQFSFFLFCKPELVQTFLTLSCRSIITSALMINYVYINELFPTSLRGMAYGTVLFGTDMTLVLAPLLVQYLSKISYPAAVSALMLSALIWAIVMIFFKEETKDVAQSDSVSHSERKSSRKQ